MSTPRDLKVYRFATRAQWKTGLFSKIRMHGDDKSDSKLIPAQPLAPSPRFVASADGASSPAISPYGVAYWLTSKGYLQWMEEADTTVCSIEASSGIAHSPRLAIGREWLWAFQANTGCLFRYDLDSLQQDDVIRLPHERILDIAADGRDGVWLLVALGGADTAHYALYHVDAESHVGGPAKLPSDIADPLGFTYLADLDRVVVLSKNGEAISLVDVRRPAALPGQRSDAFALSAPVTVSLQQQTSGFRATLIDSDHRDRILVCGTITQGYPDSKPSLVLLLDAEGGLFGSITKGLDSYLPITGATARKSAVLVTTAKGILWFDAKPASDGMGADGIWLTPCLYSPETESLRGWLRAELSAVLPKGATLAVTVMSTSESRVHEDVVAIFEDATLPPRARQQQIEAKLGAGHTGPFTFIAPEDDPSRPQTPSSDADSPEPQSFAVPLFDHPRPWLWLKVQLHASPDGRLPELRQLRAFYPEISLTQYLPAIFRGDVAARGPEWGDPLWGDPTGFFRQFVGVLETTTQGIDQTISSLWRRIHPATAQGEWLDFVARWLDLPWDDALCEQLKRRILGGAPQLLARRGTRTGLETLLSLLFSHEKIRVIDVNVDFGLAITGGKRCQGSALPAVLTGLPPQAAVLSRKAVLGRARLNCPSDDPTGAVRFMGLLRVEIFASTEERKAVEESVLRQLLAAMTPAGLRTTIRWRSEADLAFNTRLDDGITLDDPSPRRLGQDARLGQLALAGGKYPRLTESGLGLGFRLK